MQLIVNSLLSQYESVGQGKLVLLLHGWGDDHRSFAALQEQLSNEYKILALDLPGFGQTQAPDEVWDLDNYAKFVSAFLGKTGTEPYAIIGHSNGGAVVIRGIAEGILNCEKLVLLASAGIRDTQNSRRLMLKIIAKIGKVTTFWLPHRYRQTLRKKLYGVAGSDMLVAPQLQETFKKTVRQDVQADAVKIQIPTLLIYGDNDSATPPAIGEKLASLIPNSELQILTEAGHFVHHDQLEKVTGLIRKFLQ